MSPRTPLSLLAAILLLVLLAQCLFVVPQGSMGVVLRLEAPVAIGLQPGAHLKLPFLDKVLYLDAGGIMLDSDDLNGGYLKFNTADGGTLTARYFAVWRIRDATALCRSLACDEGAAARELNRLIVAGLRDTLATQTRAGAMAGQEALTAGFTLRLAPAAAHYGADLEVVQLTGVGLPTAGMEDIYTRMRSTEETRAAQLAAEGAARAVRKRAETDAQRDQILAAADATVARIRAGGEADAAAIYAQAARQEPDFFSFFQGLAAYRRSLAGKTVLVLDPDSPYLRYLKPPQR